MFKLVGNGDVLFTLTNSNLGYNATSRIPFIFDSHILQVTGSSLLKDYCSQERDEFDRSNENLRKLTRLYSNFPYESDSNFNMAASIANLGAIYNGNNRDQTCFDLVGKNLTIADLKESDIRKELTTLTVDDSIELFNECLEFLNNPCLEVHRGDFEYFSTRIVRNEKVKFQKP